MNAVIAGSVLGAVLFVAGVVHLLPVTGVQSARRLHALYGVQADDAVVLLLLRHRALLFGVLGAAFIASAFTPAWRVVASVVALFCMLSFVGLARGTTAAGGIGWIVKIDLALSALLGLALLGRLLAAD